MAPKSMTTSSPGSMRRSDGRAWGRAAFGPLATIVSKATASAPRRRISKSRAMANSCSVGRLAEELFHLGEGDVGDVGRPLDAGELALVLDDAERLDRPRHGDELGAGPEAARPRRCWAPQVMSSASRPRRSQASCQLARWPRAGPPGRPISIRTGAPAALTCSADWSR